jgi:hypothetical protein
MMFIRDVLCARVFVSALLCAGVSVAMAAAGPGVEFKVSFPESARTEAANGRIVVMLVNKASKVAGARPIDAPFWSDPQPLFGINVTGLKPGAVAVVGDSATSFPFPPGELPAGEYKAQAAFIINRESSSWRREEGNLYSKQVEFTVPAAGAGAGAGAGVGVGGAAAMPVELSLTEKTRGRQEPKADNAEVFQMRSVLLSGFHGRDVFMRAGVIFPEGWDKDRRAPGGGEPAPAVYEVPGFGGDHRSAFSPSHPYRRADGPNIDDWKTLRSRAFWIVLDPESVNGHTLFADSENNGPVGQALVREFIPALEARYNLSPKPEARLLRGHSSGGWSSVWLAVTYPRTFGAAWSSAPDPVDFRRFQLADIYDQTSMYIAPDADAAHQRFGVADTFIIGADGVRYATSYRSGGKPLMTVKQENLMEEVFGPFNGAGAQWDSWQAVFGPRTGGGVTGGTPAPLFDSATGLINPEVAELYRKYDISLKLRENPGEIGPIFKQRIRIVVGDKDNFFLDHAVMLLKDEVDKLSFLQLPEGDHGKIEIVPGADHGSIFASPQVQGIPREMVEHLTRNGFK